MLHLKAGQFVDQYKEVRYWTGVNVLDALEEVRSQLYRTSAWCFATGVTSWDRLLPCRLMAMFFRKYMVRGLPPALVDFCLHNTVQTVLFTKDDRA